MIKGHTTIELTNVKTGEVERVEDDNMFTQAIPQMMNFISTHGIYATGWEDINSAECWKSLLGGIYLFEKSIDERSILPVGGNKMVGCGSIDYNNSNANLPEMGSYNNAESDTTGALVKKFVYDFTTNQANGTIASVCLTSQYGGYYGAGAAKKINILDPYNYDNNKKAIAMSKVVDHTKNIKIEALNETTYGRVNSSFLNFCVDSKNDIMYSFSVSTDKLRIGTNNMSVDKFDLFRSAYNTQNEKIDEYNYEAGFSGTYFYCFYNTDEKNLYFWTNNSDERQYQNNKSITIYKFSIDEKKLSKHCDFTNKTGTSISRNIVVTGEYIYVRGNRKIHKIKVENMNVEKVIGDNIEEVYHNFSYIINGIITFELGYMDKSRGAILVDTKRDDAISYSGPSIYYYNNNYHITIIPPIDSDQLIFGSNEGYRFLGIPFNDNGDKKVNTWAPTTYLATINNLGSPVTKTADKTMKITYTITDEDG